MEETQENRKERQRLEIALSKAIDVPEEQGLNERAEEYNRINHFYELYGIDSAFSKKIKDQVAEKGKAEFYQQVDPLNRLISAEDQLSDRKGVNSRGSLKDYLLSHEETAEQLEKILDHLGIELEDLEDTDLR